MEASTHQDVRLVGSELGVHEALAGELQGVQVQALEESGRQGVGEELAEEIGPAERGAEEPVVGLMQVLHALV